MFEKFDLDRYLRYALSGGISLLTFYSIYPEAFSIYVKGSYSVFITFNGACAFLIGSLLYVLHRAVVLPAMVRIFLYKWVSSYSNSSANRNPSEKIWKFYRASDFDIDLDKSRWEKKKDEKSPQKDLQEWASQIHFMYTSILGIVLAEVISPMLPYHFGENYFKKIWLLHLITIAGLLFGAITSHMRYLRYEQDIHSDVFSKPGLS